MPIRLDTVLTKVEQMSNKVNSDLLKEFYQHMKDNGTSQNYQKGNLKAMIHFAEHIGGETSFFDVDHKQVLRFLDAKIKSEPNKLKKLSMPHLKKAMTNNFIITSCFLCSPKTIQTLVFQSM